MPSSDVSRECVYVTLVNEEVFVKDDHCSIEAQPFCSKKKSELILKFLALQNINFSRFSLLS